MLIRRVDVTEIDALLREQIAAGLQDARGLVLTLTRNPLANLVGMQQEDSTKGISTQDDFSSLITMYGRESDGVRGALNHTNRSLNDANLTLNDTNLTLRLSFVRFS